MVSLQFNLSPNQYRSARNVLRTMFSEYPTLFKALFHEHRSVEYPGEYLLELQETGLIEYTNGQWNSRYCVFEFDDQFFVTDSFLLPETDRVFPLSQDESLFLARQLVINENDYVLDIGTGSGIYAIVAARKAGGVVALDINSKALQYAQFNAYLNNVEDKILFLSSDVFTKVSMERKFNVIISNPAIIPTPPHSGFYIHSDGGLTGTNMSFDILRNFHHYLSDSGRLYMLATTFVRAQQKALIYGYIENKYRHMNIKFSIQVLYQPGLQNLSLLVQQFKQKSHCHELKNMIDVNRYTSLEYLFITAQRATRFSIEEHNRPIPFEKNIFNGDWKGRLARLFHVYNKITQKTHSRNPTEMIR